MSINQLPLLHKITRLIKYNKYGYSIILKEVCSLLQILGLKLDKNASTPILLDMRLECLISRIEVLEHLRYNILSLEYILNEPDYLIHKGLLVNNFNENFSVSSRCPNKSILY